MNTQKSKVAILGTGEIGRSMMEVLKPFYKVYGKSRSIDELKYKGIKEVDVLHVCIPFSDDFIKIVTQNIHELKPKLTIINSTVMPGTTREIARRSVKCCVVNSPVLGVHPNLAQGIKTFKKFVGGLTKEAIDMAIEHFKVAGVECIGVLSPESTEWGKILDTTTYGIQIVVEKEIHALCQKHKLDFNTVYTNWTTNYNEGYTKLGMGHVARPVLKHSEGKIGGHCVVPNAIKLEKFRANPLSKFLLQRNDYY
jgi:3-hydroxyisobutyrate dehydrogenase-like beta-hydroxyacid dehydrogenase